MSKDRNEIKSGQINFHQEIKPGKKSELCEVLRKKITEKLRPGLLNMLCRNHVLQNLRSLQKGLFSELKYYFFCRISFFGHPLYLLVRVCM